MLRVALMALIHPGFIPSAATATIQIIVKTLWNG